ncbi:hypothetical protein DI272_23595 [Streptomyces sp. Act143]|nr:hypothetical protein DI272_23595 [Streptomyces sp. Act143]
MGARAEELLGVEGVEQFLAVGRVGGGLEQPVPPGGGALGGGPGLTEVRVGDERGLRLGGGEGGGGRRGGRCRRGGCGRLGLGGGGGGGGRGGLLRGDGGAGGGGEGEGQGQGEGEEGAAGHGSTGASRVGGHHRSGLDGLPGAPEKPSPRSPPPCYGPPMKRANPSATTTPDLVPAR